MLSGRAAQSPAIPQGELRPYGAAPVKGSAHAHPEFTSGSWRRRGQGAAVVLGAAALAAVSALPAAAAGSSRSLPAHTRFAFHTPDPAAIQQVGQLFGQHDAKDAIAGRRRAAHAAGRLVHQGHARARSASRSHKLVTQDNAVRTVPPGGLLRPRPRLLAVLLGRRRHDAAYQAWIDGFVKGLGHGKAVVVVEPDGLANLPQDCPSAYPGQDIAALTASRLADIKYAADALETTTPTRRSTSTPATAPGRTSARSPSGSPRPASTTSRASRSTSPTTSTP